MKRVELEHIIRAACDIADDDELIIIGSQSILGQFPEAPSTFLQSMEADVYPKNRIQLADVIDGCIGELSPFQDLYGYYAQGVGPETAILPKGWEDRLIPIRNANTRYCTGYCLEIHDLAAGKYAASREKDLTFVQALADHKMVDQDILRKRLAALPVRGERKESLIKLALRHFQNSLKP